MNIRAAKVNCGSIEGAMICDFFQITTLPRLIVLRPDFNDQWFSFPVGEPSLYTATGILNFIAIDFEQAFTAGVLAQFAKQKDLDYFTGFINFLHKTLMTLMEENYVQMYEMGLVGSAKDSYIVVLLGGISTLFLPVFVIFSAYTTWKMMKSKFAATGTKTTIASDPDFMPDEADDVFAENDKDK